ncbi:MAG: UbiA family prenyltransferase [Ignavibacteria bacterium]|nr:UbiA family prenyltransferase [Ignavibacteria bacterium]
MRNKMNTLAIKTYPPFSLKFSKAYILTMRPYLMFVSGITGVLGMSFAGEISLLKALFIFKVTFLSYGFGQALTDCFQIDTDSISSPYRPLTQGIVKKNHFLIISIIGLFYCISVLAFYNPINLALGILAGFGLATYTTFKRKWWAGPFYNAWIVVVLFLMAYLAGLGKIYFDFSNLIFIAAVLTVFFGYANFVITGYFKDIEADTATAYNTLPVKFGRKLSSIASDFFGIAASVSVFATIFVLAFNSFPHQIILKALVFAYAGIAATIFTQLNLHSVNTDSEAHRAIVPCVHSYILMLSSFAVLNKPDWFIPLILFYLLYFVVIKTRPAKEQI